MLMWLYTGYSQAHLSLFQSCSNGKHILLYIGKIIIFLILDTT